MADQVQVNIKHTAYTNAINRLEGYLKELQSARDDYEQQRQQFSQFWTGDSADSATKTIEAAIKQVDTAAQSVQENIEALKAGQQSASTIDKSIQDKMAEARRAIESLY